MRKTSSQKPNQYDAKSCERFSARIVHNSHPAKIRYRARREAEEKISPRLTSPAQAHCTN